MNYTYSLTGGKGKDIKDEPLTAKVTRSIILLDTIPYRPRLMDSRIGIFPTMKNEYSAAKQTTRSIYYANRWRLEPSDLRGYIEGKKVTPIKPIVFYVLSFTAWSEAYTGGTDHIGFIQHLFEESPIRLLRPL